MTRPKGPPGRPADAAGPPAAAAATLLVLGLVLAAVGVRVWLNRKIAAPQILCDEFIYADVAKNFARDGRLVLRDHDWQGSLLYPVAIAPAWFADSMSRTYELVKTINAGLMALAAVPLFFWARRLVPSGYAVLPVALTLLLPAFNFAGFVMTENAFFPAFVLACFALALALERPTVVTQAFALGAVAVACVVRVQGLVLVAAYLAAILLMAVLEVRARGERLRRSSLLPEIRPFWLTGAALALAAAFYLVVSVVRGVSLVSGLGGYQSVVTTDYSPLSALYWGVLHVAEISLATGIVPACALVVLMGLALSRAPARRSERAFLAVTASALACMAFQVGAFTSRYAEAIVERYSFYLAPLLFLALTLWLARGLPRPRLLSAVAAGSVLALVLAIPSGQLALQALAVNTLGLYPFYELSLDVASDWARRGILIGGVALALTLFALAPRRVTIVAAPLLIGAFLGLSSQVVFGAVERQAAASNLSAGSPRSWIQSALGPDREAAFLYKPKDAADVHQSSSVLLQTQFWNPNVDTVYSLGDRELCPLPERQTRIEYAGGRILEPEAAPDAEPPEFVVLDPALQIAGERIAAGGSTTFPLELFRVEPPLRLVAATEGVAGDAWMGAQAAYTYYGPRPAGGLVEVTLSRSAWDGPDVPGRVRIEVGSATPGEDGTTRMGRVTVTRRWVIHRQLTRVFWIQPPPGPFRVEVHVTPTFSPADFGRPDPRQLGALVSFRVLDSEQPPDE